MLSAILTLTLMSQVPEHWGPRRFRTEGSANRFPGGASVVDELYPSSGAGVTAISSDLCEHPDFTKAGNWWCLKGDGTSGVGGMDLTPTGSPVAASRRVCPNGTNCNAPTGRALDGVDDVYETTDVALASDDFTVCAAYLNAAAINLNTLVSIGDVGTVQLYTNTSEQFGFFLDGVATLSGGSAKGGSFNFQCGVFDKDGTAPGTHKVELYVNGVLTTSSTPAVAPSMAGTRPWVVGARRTGVGTYDRRFKADVTSVLYTEAALTSTQIANLSRSAIGNITTTRGTNTLTISRNSAATMLDPDGKVHWVSLNRLRYQDAGILTEQGGLVFVVLYSEQMDHATAWSKVGVVAAAPTVTANQGASVEIHGPSTADNVAFAATTVAGTASYLRQDVAVPTGQGLTVGLWGHTTSGTTTQYLHVTSASGVTIHDRVACAFTTTPSFCVIEDVQGSIANTTVQVRFGVDRGDGSQSGQSAATVRVWGFHGITRGAGQRHGLHYLRTEGTTVSSATEDLYFTSPIDASNPSKWCVRFRAEPMRITNWSNMRDSFFFTNTNGGGVTNIFSLDKSQASSQLNFSVNDGAGAIRTAAVAGAFSPGAHTIRACYLSGINNAKVYVDGVAQTVTLSGAGTGLLSDQPDRLEPGTQRSTNAGGLNGWIKHICFGRGSETVCP